MRLPAAVIAASLLAQGLIAPAQAEDRFGPRPRAAEADAKVSAPPSAPAFEASRALRWSGKTAAPAAAAPSDIHTLQSQPLAGGLLSRTSAAPRAVLRPSQNASAQPALARPARAEPAPTQLASATPQLRGPVGPAAQPRAPAPQPPVAQPAERVTSPAASQFAPRPAPAPAPAPSQARLQPQPQAQAQAQPQAQAQAPLPTSLFDDAPDPAHQAAAAAAVPARPVAVAGANGAVGPRYYSIHRGYGEQPDPIPMTQTGVGQ